MNPDTWYVCDGCDDDPHTCGKDTDECEQEIVDARANAADLERKSRLEDVRCLEVVADEGDHERDDRAGGEDDADDRE